MNLSQIQRYLTDNDLDGWLLYDFRGQNPIALHVAGLTGSGTRRWFLWIPAAGDPAWLIHAIETNTFRNTDPALGDDKRIYAGWRDMMAELPRLVGAGDDKRLRIAMEYSPLDAIPYVSKIDAGIKELVERATDAAIVTSADLVQFTQATLSAEQLASHRRAAVHCLAVKDDAFALIADRLRAGQPVDEYAVQQFIVERFAALDLDPDHPPIVAVNANAANPHYAPGPEQSSPICAGDMVLIDLWAKERATPDACFADITWTAYCGDEPPAKAQRIFEIVAAARNAAVAFIRERFVAGQPVYGYEVDDACRAVIQEAGYSDAFFHRTGHSLGTEVHFTGVNIDNLETQDRRQLMPGIMFTIEPGIYLPDYDFDGSPVAKGLGIRSEINCFVHEDGVEVTTLPLQEEIVRLEIGA